MKRWVSRVTCSRNSKDAKITHFYWKNGRILGLPRFYPAVFQPIKGLCPKYSSTNALWCPVGSTHTLFVVVVELFFQTHFCGSMKTHFDPNVVTRGPQLPESFLNHIVHPVCKKTQKTCYRCNFRYTRLRYIYIINSLQSPWIPRGSSTL